MKRSEAAQQEAAAKREDASAATEMMGLLERTVAHMERMNDYNKSNAEGLLLMVRERDELNNRLKKDLELLVNDSYLEVIAESMGIRMWPS